jgi:hypothetical protein
VRVVACGACDNPARPKRHIRRHSTARGNSNHVTRCSVMASETHRSAVSAERGWVGLQVGGLERIRCLYRCEVASRTVRTSDGVVGGRGLGCETVGREHHARQPARHEKGMFHQLPAPLAEAAAGTRHAPGQDPATAGPRRRASVCGSCDRHVTGHRPAQAIRSVNRWPRDPRRSTTRRLAPQP